MYHSNSPYSGYQTVPQSMRPPSHPPPPLSIPGHAQAQYSSYSINSSPAGSVQLRQTPMMPQSPSEASERAGPEEEYFNLPGPKPTSHIWGGYIWALEVVQHPQRARMCGFGDKDRRPISPPPCIRLVILNPATKEELDYHDIDLTHLVLTVDIWDLSAGREMNLVKQSNASPCISSAATGAYPTTAAPAPPNHDAPRPYDVNNIPGFSQHQYTSPPTPGGGNNYYQSSSQGYPPRTQYVNGQNGHPSPYQNGSSAYARPSYAYQDPRYGTPQPQTPSGQFSAQLPPINSMTNPITSMEHNYVHQPPASTQLYTRNLIGSLCASAFRLKDENDKWGIWFVLQDLSVRTEGWFRLKMNFFNISQAVAKQIQEATNGGPSNLPTNPRDTAPCLASTFSNPFRVYSAKKFPGVVESTPLSKAFANQGIKIPIRKDTGGKRGRDNSDEEDSGGDE